MALDLSILYRGPLSSCNYGCDYCPFAKKRESAAELQADRACLERFVEWSALRVEDRLGVLFTPWGEALVRRWYQEALIRLTRLRQVQRAAIQTNLSCRLDWLDQCDLTKLALWATFHPTECERPRFLAQCRELDRRSARYSVGVVGLKEHFAEIEALRRELPPHVYLWINAYKRQAGYYALDEVEWLQAIDPLFAVNNRYHDSRGKACRTGRTVISVDGDGTIRRCHFARAPIGNIYEPGFESALIERPCPNATCGCHIGYVHLDELQLYAIFGSGVLERVPDRPPPRLTPVCGPVARRTPLLLEGEIHAHL